MKTKMPNGSRLLKDNEVPQPGDFYIWADNERYDWVEITKVNSQLHALPVATLRHRAGQPAMQFCTQEA